MKPYQAVADELRVEPEDDGGENKHCAIIDRALLISGGDPTPLFEPIDAALHHVATGRDGFVKEEGPSWSNCPLRTLVVSLGNGVLDLPLAQPPSTARIAVAFVGDEPIRASAWSPPPGGAWDPDAVQDGLQLRTIVTLSWGNRPLGRNGTKTLMRYHDGAV